MSAYRKYIRQNIIQNNGALQHPFIISIFFYFFFSILEVHGMDIYSSLGDAAKGNILPN